MGSREFPWDPNEVCDNCGNQGAFDLYGDYVCGDCLHGGKTMTEGPMRGGTQFREPGVKAVRRDFSE